MAEPLDVVGSGTGAYLAAFCLSRREQRTFHMDRILAMALEPTAD